MFPKILYFWLHNQLRLSSELRSFEGKRTSICGFCRDLTLSLTDVSLRGEFGRESAEICYKNITKSRSQLWEPLSMRLGLYVRLHDHIFVLQKPEIDRHLHLWELLPQNSMGGWFWLKIRCINRVFNKVWALKFRGFSTLESPILGIRSSYFTSMQYWCPLPMCKISASNSKCNSSYAGF